MRNNRAKIYESCTGKTAKEIASELELSVKTVYSALRGLREQGRIKLETCRKHSRKKIYTREQ